MSVFFDEISVNYWKKNRIQTGNKSFTCIHNGYVYGDKMKQHKGIQFIYKDNEKEVFASDVELDIKQAYFAFTQKACNDSDITFKNYIECPAEKYRLFSEEQVKSFSEKQKKSTRIKNESSKIFVKDNAFYVANNLKVCEYFNCCADFLDLGELDKWYIRIGLSPKDTLRYDSEETEVVDVEKPIFSLEVKQANRKHKSKSVHTVTRTIKCDFIELNKVKKYLGDIGERLAYYYETQRLMLCERNDLAEQIIHTSDVEGDGAGYDIESYTKDGKKLYIEVKTC